MSSLGQQLWRAYEHKTAAVRLMALPYMTKCESKVYRLKRATTGIECRDPIGGLIIIGAHPHLRVMCDFCRSAERNGFEPAVPFLNFLTTTVGNGFDNRGLSSGCSRIGTESSNPLRSAGQSPNSRSL